MQTLVLARACRRRRFFGALILAFQAAAPPGVTSGLPGVIRSVTVDPAVPTDAELLDATLDGDEEAFVEIYRRHRDRVHRFAYRMTGSLEAARDVTHSCFASLLENPRRYEGARASLGTYLCAAARNLGLRHAGRAWRERPAGGSPDLSPSHEPGPLERLLSDERSRLVREAILGPGPAPPRGADPRRVRGA